MPGGEPIELFPRRVGLYKLVDRSHDFAFVDVYVVPYPTTAITDRDGRFEIDRIPAGKVEVNALLPATGQTIEREVTVKEGAPVEVILEFEFDAKQFAEQAEQAKAAKGVSSQSPAQ